MTIENERPSSQAPRPTNPVYRRTQASGGRARTSSTMRPRRTSPATAITGTTVSTPRRRPVGEYYHRVREYYRRSPRLQRIVYQRRFGPAFWTVASVLSLIVNIILIAVILILGRQLFNMRTILSEGLLGGLYTNFVKMDQAHILTSVNVNSTIEVQDQIPVVFDLPLNQNTQVVLTTPTSINGATIFLNGVAVPLNLILPSGTSLNIGMDMVVPVSTTIPVVLDVPVNLSVPVDIPLDQTELHEPFVGLQTVILPYNELISETPSSWEEIEGCNHWYSRWVCKLVFGTN